MIFDFLMSILRFIFRNFFAIVGVGVLATTIWSIVKQDNKKSCMCKGPSLLLLFGTVLHVYVFWTTMADADLLMTAVRCLLPAFFAFCAGVIFHNPSRGSIREYIAIIITYTVSYILTGIFSSVLVGILALVLGLIVVFLILSDRTNQFMMDYHSRERFPTDSEEVRKLYKKGYRPTGYYKDSKSHSRAVRDLIAHGVNPYDPDDNE